VQLELRNEVLNVRYELITISKRRRLLTLENSNYKDEIFTKRVRAGKRTYFFDVKATKSEKDFYITITESKRVGEEEYEKHKIFLYKEDFDKFADALMETVDYVQDELLVAPPTDQPAVEEKAL
jgi:Protein of unknown function (DUF3276).